MFRRFVGILSVSLCVLVSTKAQHSDTTLEVVSWNIEWFGAASASNGPANKNLQESNVVRLLRWMNADLYGLVEVVDTMRFRRVVDSLGRENYGYVISPYCTQATQPSGNAWLNGQKMAFIYRKSVFSNVSSRGLMRNSATANTNWATGRFPFMLSATVTLEGVSKDMNFIVIHAKAGSEQSDYQKRLGGAQELKDTLDRYYSNTFNLLIGDYNDALHTSIYPGSSSSSYLSFVMDSTDTDHYKSITLPLGLAGQTTMINYPNVIDNHLISNEVAPFYIPQSARVVTDVTSQVPDYVTAGNTSDHYPVLSRYDLNGSIVTGLPVISLSQAGIRVWPNPVQDRLQLVSERALKQVRITVYDLQGRTIQQFEKGFWQAGEWLRVASESWHPGIYFVQISTPAFTTYQKIIK